MTSIFRISNNSGQGPVQAFVSYTDGSETWYTLPPDYSDLSESDWHRAAGWQTVVFYDQNAKRRGFYLENFANTILEIEFYGIERDLGLNYIDATTGAQAPGV